MFPDILNILVAGLLAGFIFSMPVAGPISITITSNALKGKLRFCQRAAIGASVVEFIYVFIVIVGIKTLYTYYQPIIPYLILGGAVFLFFVGLKIIKTKIDLGKIPEEDLMSDKEINKGGMRAGLILNFTNPSLFIGWLVSSFLVFSLMSQFNLGTGGLDMIINDNVNSVSEIAGDSFEKLQEIQGDTLKTAVPVKDESSMSTLIMASVYAAAVAFGGFLWLYYFSKIIVNYRMKLNLGLINNTIKVLGFVLIGISLFLTYKSVFMF
ncbi:MAG: LysE family transporter [Melioribacteraceae bacterium]|nr:LysE family transporter [Melioribacteraceae bacterium]